MLPSYESPLRFQEGWSSLQTHSRTPRNPPRGLTLQMGMLGNLKARTALRMCSKNLQLAPNCGSWVSRGPASARESGTFGAAIHHEVSRFRGAVLRPTFLSNTKTFHPETLPPNLGHSPLTCLWEIPPLRHRNRRSATVCVAEDGERFGMGICRSLPQSGVETLRDGEEVELLLRGQPCEWSVTSRQEAGPRKAHPPARRDSVPVGAAERAGSHHGALRHTDGYASRGDSRSAQEGCEFRLWPDPGRAGLLSRLVWLTQDQRQPTYPSPARGARESPHAHMRARHDPLLEFRWRLIRHPRT